MTNSPPQRHQSRRNRLGHRLFLIYAGVYVCFVIANAFWPSLMELTPVGKLNLAVLTGVGLIAFACLLSVVYGGLRARADPRSRDQRGQDDS